MTESGSKVCIGDEVLTVTIVTATAAALIAIAQASLP